MTIANKKAILIALIVGTIAASAFFCGAAVASPAPYHSSHFVIESNIFANDQHSGFGWIVKSLVHAIVIVLANIN